MNVHLIKFDLINEIGREQKFNVDSGRKEEEKMERRNEMVDKAWIEPIYRHAV